MVPGPSPGRPAPGRWPSVGRPTVALERSGHTLQTCCGSAWMLGNVCSLLTPLVLANLGEGGAPGWCSLSRSTTGQSASGTSSQPDRLLHPVLLTCYGSSRVRVCGRPCAGRREATPPKALETGRPDRTQQSHQHTPKRPSAGAPAAGRAPRALTRGTWTPLQRSPWLTLPVPRPPGCTWRPVSCGHTLPPRFTGGSQTPRPCAVGHTAEEVRVFACPPHTLPLGSHRLTGSPCLSLFLFPLFPF